MIELTPHVEKMWRANRAILCYRLTSYDEADLAACAADFEAEASAWPPEQPLCLLLDIRQSPRKITARLGNSQSTLPISQGDSRRLINAQTLQLTREIVAGYPKLCGCTAVLTHNNPNTIALAAALQSAQTTRKVQVFINEDAAFDWLTQYLIAR